MVDELRLHRTGTQCTNPLAQHVPDDHEGNVSAIAVRLVCRCATEQPQHRPSLPKLDILAVDADEELQEEWEAEDDVEEGSLDTREVKTSGHKEMCICGTGRCVSMPPKRKHGHERDATQLVSS